MLNGFFANKVDKSNNKKVYYSSLKEKKKNTKSVYQKINDIFNSRNYIYKADVVITTNDGTFSKRIIGRNKVSLITDKNEVIPIDSIIDIEYQ